MTAYGSGEAWDYFTRQGLEAVIDGDQDLLVRRWVNGALQEFVIFGVDGTELHFQQEQVSDTVNCAFSDRRYCPAAWGTGGQDVMSGGKAALTRAVSLKGEVTEVSRSIATGLLLRLRDAATGGTVELLSDGVNLALARTLRVNGSAYLHYDYTLDGTYQASGHDLTAVRTATSRTIRGYSYNQDHQHPGHLYQVLGEADVGQAGPLLVQFGYDASHRATQVTDERSSATVQYLDLSSIQVDRAASGTSSTTGHSRRGGRSGGVLSNGAWERAYRWAQRQVSCFTDEDGRTTWLDRDQHRRVLRVRRFAAGIFACGQKGDPTEEMPTTWDVSYAYGLERTVAPGLPTVKLDIPTSVTRASLLSNGATTVQTYDFSAAWAPGDPSGYECVAVGVTLPAGAAPCRILESGFTRTLAGATVPETRATFYSYDQYARVTRVIGPVSLARPYADDVAPLEARAYYPTDDAQVARRGRLKAVERTPSGASGDPNASVATYDYVQTGVASIAVRRWYESAASSAEDTFVLVNDERGRPTSILGPTGTSSVDYFDGRRPSLVVTPGGGAYRLLYWPFGRVKEIRALASDPRPSGANPAVLWREVRTYDPAGNPTLVERFDANGALRFSQARTFDADHKLLAADHPMDPTRKATWSYTPAGRLDFWVDENGTRTELSPDATGRPQGVARVIRDANQAVLQQLQLATYVWETPEDLVKSVTDGAGNTTTYVHDDFGRVVSVDAPSAVGATPARLEWDVRSNLKKRTLGSATVTYAYDGLDRVTSVSATSTAGAAPVYQAFTYDFDGGAGSMVGRLRTATSGTSPATPKRTTTYSWDAAGRLERESLAVSGVAATLETVHAHDANGVETTVTYPSGFSAIFHPDEAGQVTGVDARSSTGATRPLATLVRHEPLGPVRSLTFGNNLSMSRVSNLRYEPDLLASGPLAFDYGVGWSGNVKTVATSGAGTTTFGYDLANRLTSLTPGLGASVPSVAYGYTDPSLKQAVTQAKVMTGASLVPAQAFGYDQQRSLSAVGKYDAAGVTIPTTVCLVHDALGRLTAVGPALARLTGPGALACQSEADLAAVTTRFEYDALGRRAARQDGSTWVEYVHEPGGRLLAEVVRPAVASGSWSTRREYVWLDGEPLAQLEYPGPAGRTDGWTYYVHLDHLGTPRALTSEAGATVWSAAPVRPYGDVVETTATDPANGRTVMTNLRLPGQYDERLLASVSMQGPYYNWNRWYLPSMGRYMELDPIALAGGFNGRWGPDWYGYALQNPGKWIDPTGLYTEVIIWGPDGSALKSIMGHVSVNIDGISYSFTPSGMDIRPFANYVTQSQARRLGQGIMLLLTPAQERQLAQRLKSVAQDAYRKVSNNCGAPIQQGLRDLGIQLPDDYILPNSLREALLQLDIAIGEVSYPLL